jgi:hypothetical protein
VLQLLVTCAKAKRGAAPPRRRLRTVGLRPVAAAADVWVERLSAATGTTTPAAELYRGDHWKAASDAAAAAVEAGGRAWVASAGYGLVPFDAPLRPYSATFASGDPDSVSRFAHGDPDASAVWWAGLARWEGPSPGHPRRLGELVRQAPGDMFVAVLSEPYLRALGSDLLAARDHLRAPDRLIVLCGGAPPEHPLAGNLVRWDSRAQIVDGALTSMNARVARRLLAEVPVERLTLATARDRVAAWAATAPSRTRPERVRVTDDDVRAFIRERVATDPAESPSAMHRAFRDSGLACERLRFLSLLRTLVEE